MEREIYLNFSISVWFGQCRVITVLLLLILCQHFHYKLQSPGLCKPYKWKLMFNIQGTEPIGKPGESQSYRLIFLCVCECDLKLR